jgi:hypothetical protein
MQAKEKQQQTIDGNLALRPDETEKFGCMT